MHVLTAYLKGNPFKGFPYDTVSRSKGLPSDMGFLSNKNIQAYQLAAKNPRHGKRFLSLLRGRVCNET